MMPPATPALKHETIANTEPKKEVAHSTPIAVAAGEVPRRLPNALAGAEPQKRPITAKPLTESVRQNGFNFQPRTPVLQGEAIYRGWMPVDGIISGHLGATGNSLTIKQRPRNGAHQSEPELNGEITFKDMLRINGHVAGRVSSAKGTLIVDASAKVDACIEVRVAVINGKVNGDVIGHERVEIGPGAVINGSISTRSLMMRPGAVFDGDCRMLRNDKGDK